MTSPAEAVALSCFARSTRIFTTLIPILCQVSTTMFCYSQFLHEAQILPRSFQGGRQPFRGQFYRLRSEVEMLSWEKSFGDGLVWRMISPIIVWTLRSIWHSQSVFRPGNHLSGGHRRVSCRGLLERVISNIHPSMQYFRPYSAFHNLPNWQIDLITMRIRNSPLQEDKLLSERKSPIPQDKLVWNYSPYVSSMKLKLLQNHKLF